MFRNQLIYIELYTLLQAYIRNLRTYTTIPWNGEASLYLKIVAICQKRAAYISLGSSANARMRHHGCPHRFWQMPRLYSLLPLQICSFYGLKPPLQQYYPSKVFSPIRYTLIGVAKCSYSLQVVSAESYVDRWLEYPSTWNIQCHLETVSIGLSAKSTSNLIIRSLKQFARRMTSLISVSAVFN